MKHENVPGYTDLREKLFRTRFELEVTRDENERAQIYKRLKEIRKEIASVLYLERIKQEEEKKRGR